MKFMQWAITVGMLAAVSAAANEAPVANAGPDQTVSAGVDGKATVTLNGSASTDPNSDTLTYEWTGPFSENNGRVNGSGPAVTLPIGNHTLTLKVTDTGALSSTDTVSVKVEDRTAPVITEISVDPKLLWPPNHKMVPVTVSVTAADNSGEEPVCTITEIVSDEPLNDRGDGNTDTDWEVTGDLTADIRAERAGPGDGREYTLTIECSDASGNTATREVKVIVPHDRGHLAELEEEDDGTTATTGTGTDDTKGKKPKKNKRPKKKKKAKSSSQAREIGSEF
jgi:hypothetical protein